MTASERVSIVTRATDAVSMSDAVRAGGGVAPSLNVRVGRMTLTTRGKPQTRPEQTDLYTSTSTLPII
jgi:hypothetical protein